MATISDLLTIFDSNLYSEFIQKYPDIVTPETETDNLITARGISYLRIGEPDEAIKYFKILLQKNPNNRETKMYHTSAGNVWMQSCLENGNELLSQGKMQEAYESYSKINLHEFENLNKNLVFQLCNNLAVCLLNLGRAAEALDAFNSSHLTSSLEADTSAIALKRRSDTALNKAIILKSLERNEEAITEFNNSLSIQPDNLTAICGSAEILSSMGQYEEAIKITSSAIHEHPLDEKVTDLTQITQVLSLWVARGFAYIKLNQFSSAMNDFNYVITLSSQPHLLQLLPKSETSVSEAYRLRNICLSCYGDHLLSSGEILKAIEIYNEAIQIAGGIDAVSINVLFNRAYGYYQLSPNSTEYLERAIEGFKIVIERDPNHFQGQTGLGQALLNKADAMSVGTGDYYPPPPSRTPSSSLSRTPSPLSLPSNLSSDEDVSHLQEPIFLAAIESLKQAHLLDPSDTQILYNLALTLLRTTQPDAAAKKFRLLLSLSPDSDNAIKGLELCEQMLLDQSRIEALKKKRQEAQEKASAASAPPPPSPSSSVPSKDATSTKLMTPTKATPSASSASSNTSTPVSSNSVAKSPSAASATATTPTPASAVAAPAVASAASEAASSSSSSVKSNPNNETKNEISDRDLLIQIRAMSSYFPHEALKAPGPYPEGVNSAHRELYLSDPDFQTLFGANKEEFLGYPQWKQVTDDDDDLFVFLPSSSHFLG